jgi:NAD(P)-dependent dehydrogenase (short-subunit alcohol dehydrogenase family)
MTVKLIRTFGLAGGSRGIGLEISNALAEAGANVCSSKPAVGS